jgi:hypothetical protein
LPRAVHRFDSANSFCAVFFLQTAAAHLDMPELALDHPKRVLALGAHAGLQALGQVEELIRAPGPVQRPALAIGCSITEPRKGHEQTEP